MNIFLKKFGDVLSSRQAGKEAYAAFAPTLAELKSKEEVVIDFEGINSFSPSWGDEFISPIQKQYGDRVKLKNITNPSVALTISILEKVNGNKFKITI